MNNQTEVYKLISASMAAGYEDLATIFALALTLFIVWLSAPSTREKLYLSDFIGYWEYTVTSTVHCANSSDQHVKIKRHLAIFEDKGNLKAQIWHTDLDGPVTEVSDFIIGGQSNLRGTLSYCYHPSPAATPDRVYTGNVYAAWQKDSSGQKVQVLHGTYINSERTGHGSVSYKRISTERFKEARRQLESDLNSE